MPPKSVSDEEEFVEPTIQSPYPPFWENEFFKMTLEGGSKYVFTVKEFDLELQSGKKLLVGQVCEVTTEEIKRIYESCMGESGPEPYSKVASKLKLSCNPHG